MGDGDQESELGELEFLLTRYHQLVEHQMGNNNIIHTTFYLSFVFFGVLLGVVPRTELRLARAALYVFAAGIFVSMFMWTRTYINDRKVTEAKRNAILRELNDRSYSCGDLESVERFFPDPGFQRRERWSKGRRKELPLQAYYLSLAALSLVVLFADYLVVPRLTL
ncbi:hypothetical protein [Natrinema sp. 1APR25-10V2]|uniref:hypothetical protein n=1 Tax=Natrinema sp. 1APR25-10V2 TaxID=2951081 RepID=UPI0028756C4C|nr:hypothetical protein [Natrinema sp. 1APR25-10V2]MDS0474478.1 hypothetical protein [Natrinema sp. 1APR25-10V2]